jgi:hypothetical protein
MVTHVQNTGEAGRSSKPSLRAEGPRWAFGSGPELAHAALPQAEVRKSLNEQTLLMAMIEDAGGGREHLCDRRG